MDHGEIPEASELPAVYNPTRITDDVYAFSLGLKSYLEFLDLPTTGVLVEIKERETVIAIMPTIVENLIPTQRERAYYISKFIASCGVRVI